MLLPVKKSWKKTSGEGINPPMKGMNITMTPIGKGITIGSTIVQIIGKGILINGCPSKGLTSGGIGIKAGGRYPTGQYLIPILGVNLEKFSTGGMPLGIGIRPTMVAFLENSFQ
jgi:hypothetical protein